MTKCIKTSIIAGVGLTAIGISSVSFCDTFSEPEKREIGLGDKDYCDITNWIIDSTHYYHQELVGDANPADDS